MKLSLKQILLMVTLFSVASTAETIDISGTIYDEQNRPLQGAIVSLKSHGFSDTTDASGNYRIKSDETALSKPELVKNDYRIVPQVANNSIHFSLESPANVKVDLFTMSGRHIGSVVNEHYRSGTWALDLYKNVSPAKGIYLVRCVIDGKSMTLKTVFSQEGVSEGIKPVTLYSANTSDLIPVSEVFDTLVVEIEGQQISAGEITSSIVSIPPQSIIQRDFFGTIPSGYDIRRVVASITGGSISDRNLADLEYNSVTKYFSGYVYFLKSDTIENYEVEVLVYSGDLAATTSQKIAFSSRAGSVKIPDVSLGGLEWYFTYTLSDTSVNTMLHYLGDTAKLQMNFLNEKYILGNITQYLWDDGDNNSPPIWVDSSEEYSVRNIVFDTAGPYMPWGGFRTDMGQYVAFNRTMFVHENNSTIELISESDTLHRDDTVKIEAVGHDIDSIQQWIISWNQDTVNRSDTVTVPEMDTLDTLVWSMALNNEFEADSIPFTITLVDGAGRESSGRYMLYFKSAQKYVRKVLSGVSGGYYPSMEVDDENRLYFAHNIENNFGSVEMWDGEKWNTLGSSPILDNPVGYSSIDIAPDGSPVVIFQDGSKTTSECSVMKLNNAEWDFVGHRKEVLGSMGINLTVDSDSNVYVVHTAFVGTGSQLGVVKWDGTQWSQLGQRGVTGETSIYSNLQLVLDSENNPVISLHSNDDHSISVHRWNGNEWGFLGKDQIALPTRMIQPALGTLPSGELMIFAPLQDESGNQLYVWSDSSWVAKGPELPSDSLSYREAFVESDSSGAVYLFAKTFMPYQSSEETYEIWKLEENRWKSIQKSIDAVHATFAVANNGDVFYFDGKLNGTGSVYSLTKE